jgi:hypothetical protein
MYGIPVTFMYKSPYMGIDAFVLRGGLKFRIQVVSSGRNQISASSKWDMWGAEGWHTAMGEWHITI